MAKKITTVVQIMGELDPSLKSAFQTVQKQATEANKNLRATNRALKLDPSNFSLITQKQQYLKKAAIETGKKLQDEQKALTELRGRPWTQENIEQQRKLQREIAETTAAYKRLMREAINYSSDFGNRFHQLAGWQKQSGEKLTQLGRSAMSISAPAMAAIGWMGKTTATFDAKMSKVKAITGEGGKAFQQMRDWAVKMGNDTIFSATQVAEAMSDMGMMGWKFKDMQAGGKGVLNLAAASGMSPVDTAKIVSAGLTSFKMPVKEATTLANQLAAAATNSGTDIREMGEALKYVGPIAGASNYTSKQTIEALGQMANAGIKGSQAGTSLKAIMTGLNKDVTFYNSKLGEVTVKTTNANGTMRNFSDVIADLKEKTEGMTQSEKLQLANRIAGQRGYASLLQLMNKDTDNLAKNKQLLDALNKANVGKGAAAKMAETMQQNIPAQLTLLKSKLQTGAIQIFSALTPSIMKLLEHVNSVLDKFNNRFKKMPKGLQEMVAKGLLMTAALGPALLTLGKIQSTLSPISDHIGNMFGKLKFLKDLVTGGSTLANAFKNFGGLTGPLGLIGTALSKIAPALPAVATSLPAVAAGAVAVGTTAALGVAVYKDAKQWGADKKTVQDQYDKLQKLKSQKASSDKIKEAETNLTKAQTDYARKYGSAYKVDTTKKQSGKGKGKDDAPTKNRKNSSWWERQKQASKYNQAYQDIYSKSLSEPKVQGSVAKELARESGKSKAAQQKAYDDAFKKTQNAYKPKVDKAATNAKKANSEADPIDRFYNWIERKGDSWIEKAGKKIRESDKKLRGEQPKKANAQQSKAKPQKAKPAIAAAQPKQERAQQPKAKAQQPKKTNWFSSMSQTYSQGWQMMKTNAANSWGGIEKTLSEKWGNLKTRASTTFSGIGQSMSNAWQGMSGLASSAFGSINEAVSGRMSGMREAVTGKLGGIRELFSSKLASAGGAVQGAMATVHQAFASAMSRIHKFVSGKLQQIRNLFAHPITATVEIIQNIREKISGGSSGGGKSGKGGKGGKAKGGKAKKHAKGGFTQGLSIAGEDPRYPVEAVISFNPAYRSQNLNYWQRAGRMLGADTMAGSSRYYGTAQKAAMSVRPTEDFPEWLKTSMALEKNPVYLNSPNTQTVPETSPTIEMGGINFAPNITMAPSETQPDDVIRALRRFMPQFMDQVQSELQRREDGRLVSENAGL